MHEPDVATTVWGRVRARTVARVCGDGATVGAARGARERDHTAVSTSDSRSSLARQQANVCGMAPAHAA